MKNAHLKPEPYQPGTAPDSLQPRQDPSPQDVEPLFASPVELNFNQTYNGQAGDGFLLASLILSNDEQHSAAYAYDGTTFDPRGIYASASQHIANGNVCVSGSSLTMPVPAGTNYLCKTQFMSGTPDMSLQYIGFSNVGAPAIEPPVPIDLNADLSTDTDGFVLGWGECDDNSSGKIEYIKDIAGVRQTVAISSYQLDTPQNVFVKTNSFCVPIRRGAGYRVNSTTTTGTTRAYAYFVKLSQALTFPNNLDSLTPAVTYQAPTDGFVTATIVAGDGNSGTRSFGYLRVFSHPDLELMLQAGLLGAASCHGSPSDNRLVAGNTTTIPVAAGNYFLVEPHNLTNDCKVQVWWMPVTRQE